MAYTWDKANADAPTRHTTQYFEMLGNRAIYHDGWVAATTPATLPWELSTEDAAGRDHRLQLGTLQRQRGPDRVRRPGRQDAGQAQGDAGPLLRRGAKYDVLPLDNSTLARWNTPRPSLTAGRTVFTYSGELSGVPSSGAPNILNKSYTITAEVEIPEGGAEGMIVTEGGRFGGYGLFLSKGEFGVRPRQGGVPLQPARPQAHHLGRAGAGRRQAHHRLRLQVGRPGSGQGRHGRAVRGRQGSGQELHGAHHPDHLPGGRNLRRRPGHPHAAGARRVSLRRAVQVHRQDRQADLRARTGAAPEAKLQRAGRTRSPATRTQACRR